MAKGIRIRSAIYLELCFISKCWKLELCALDSVTTLAAPVE